MNFFSITIKGNHFRNFVRRLLNRVFILAFSPYDGFKTVLNLGFYVVDCGFQVLDSGFLLSGLGFSIPVVSG